jgi:Zn finger protein HypA/HybF involved in hydrogenase expression
MKYTKESLTQVVSESNSLAEVLRKLEMATTAPNYKTIRKKCKQWNIEDSNLTGKYLKIPTQPLECYLTNNSEIANRGSHSFKLRLIKAGYLIEKCLRCNINEWEGEKLSLHLDHINGIRTDNRIENLRLLCPNCHSLTNTYAGKNKIRTRTQKYCQDCNKQISHGSLRCQRCNNTTKIRLEQLEAKWPDGNELLKMVKETNCTKTAEKLGVSEHAIIKHLKKEFGNNLKLKTL